MKRVQTSETAAAPAQSVIAPLCRIEMLGCLQVVQRGENITRFARQKAGALLAYLALHTPPQPREHLIDLFWPEMDLAAGRDNLSTALGSLRRQLEPPGVRKGDVLTATHAYIRLNPAAVTTDVAEFEHLLDQADFLPPSAARAKTLEQAVALYQGDLLPGHYEDWAVREMDRLQARYLSALDRLRQDQESLSDLLGALETARRRVAADPYTETAHLDFIRLNVRLEHTGAARDAYGQFERLFQEEFGTPPATEARQTAAHLLGTLPTATAAPRQTRRELTPKPPTDTVASLAPPCSSTPYRVSLPLALSRFFGRESEIARLVHLLIPSKETPIGPELPVPPCRLVTLVGPGGIGKTRLSLEFARQAADHFGLWCGFLSLADLTSPAQIVTRIAGTLQIALDTTADPLDQIASFLRERDQPGAPPLLVLDNLEHLLAGTETGADAAEIVRDLLERTPGLAILCTSRRRLGLLGERLVTVTPLPCPDVSDAERPPQDLGRLAAIPSVRLYLDRAQAVRPDFALTETNAAAVAALCRRLEGSPLGLELAAAWVRLLPPRKMWERLTQGLDLPKGRYADLPERHRSLGAALEWSWRLLTADQQRLFARLSVFSGGWTQESGEEICGGPEVLGLLADLQDASLVVAEEDASSGETRYRFLETIRDYSRQRLRERGEEGVIRERHAQYYLVLAEQAEPELRGPQQAAWLTRLETEHDNFRGALEWLIESGESGEPEDAEAGLRLAGALMRFWNVRGHWSEGRRWLNGALMRGTDAPSSARAKALNGSGGFARLQGDIEEAKSRYEQSLAMRRALGERGRVADTLHNIALLELEQGNFDAAQPLYQESLAIQRELGDTLAVADELHHLGYLAHERGDLEQAAGLYAESLALRRPLGDLRGIAYTLNNLANLAHAQGDLPHSRVLSEEALAIRRTLGDRQGEALALQNLARYAVEEGNMATAAALCRDALTIRQSLGERQGILGCIGGLAVVVHKAGQTEKAVRLLGAAEALCTMYHLPPDSLGQDYDSLGAEDLRHHCGSGAFASAWAEGRSLSWEETLAVALQESRGK